MSDAALDFGSLNEVLKNTDPAKNFAQSAQEQAADDPNFSAEFSDVMDRAAGIAGGEVIDVMQSAGPISDAYILNTSPISCIAGPQGSGKSIASEKKFLVEGQRVSPGSDRVRRYVLGIFRQSYDALWKATIPSWWEIFPRGMTGSKWTGASPRAATHIITYEDQWGLIEATAHFLAFGDDANPEHLRGLQFTDVLLPEMDTQRPDLLTWLIGRIGRSPPPKVIGRQGRIYGDMNAPDVLNWTYKKFYQLPRQPGFQLFRQPGGLDPGAENLAAYATPRDPTGRGYYLQQVELNKDNPWWVRRMVHGIPGMSRGVNLVYDKFDETTMLAAATIKPEPILPVLVGIDGGLTPAAVYCQEMSDGQFRVLAEIGLDRGGIEELGAQMLVLEKHRFAGCEFVDRCDPSMIAGEDGATVDRSDQLVSKGSDRQRLSDVLGRRVEISSTNEPGSRWDAVRNLIKNNLGPGRPGFWLDPSCAGLLRGFLQTYHYRLLRGTNDLSSVQPTFDTHTHDALQYAALESGTASARKRKTDVLRERKKRQEAARGAGRYNPNNYARRRAGR